MNKGMLLAVTLLIAGALTMSAFAADIKATVSGKVSVQNNIASIQVKEAKDDAGKAIADLAGKTLKVVGAKSADVVKLNGKDVEAKGTVKNNNTEIEVTEVKEKPATTQK
ncbi:MAG: hypothetical protein N3G21_11365 [Candidatus Hydrogenedentes bacterium]|nr:hypothetical protein [Candidatus Hydrogenedentota bacterium]